MAQPMGQPASSLPPQDFPARSGNALAVYAIVLSISWLVISFAASAIAVPGMTRDMGNAQPSTPEMLTFLQDKIDAGDIPPWFLVLMLGGCLSLLVWIAGLVCAILAVRIPVRRRLTIAAFVLLALLPIQMVLGLILGG